MSKAPNLGKEYPRTPCPRIFYIGMRDKHTGTLLAYKGPFPEGKILSDNADVMIESSTSNCEVYYWEAL